LLPKSAMVIGDWRFLFRWLGGQLRGPGAN
jgi:hypothetical protein